MTKGGLRVVVIKAVDKKAMVTQKFGTKFSEIMNVVQGEARPFILGSVHKGRRIVLWANGDGLSHRLPPNLLIAHEETGRVVDFLVGDVVITAMSTDGNTVSLNATEVEFIREALDFKIETETKLGTFEKALWFSR